jgi:hypothetical protein
MPANTRSYSLALLAVGVVFAVTLLPPLPLPGSAVLTLADRRAFFGIPNFLDVVSNAPFAVIGAWGLRVIAARERAFQDAAEKWPYAVMFACVALTAVGSAYYHLAPDYDRLMWDRLPIALGFMALLAAVIGDRIDPKAGLALLAPLLAAGAASVLYWRWSVLQGAENLLPYAVVQYGAIAAIVLIASLYRSRYTRGRDVLIAVGIYALAKLAEVLDAPIFALCGVVAGHTLKHLIAAAAVAWLAWMLQLRSPA